MKLGASSVLFWLALLSSSARGGGMGCQLPQERKKLKLFSSFLHYTIFLRSIYESTCTCIYTAGAIYMACVAALKFLNVVAKAP